MYVTLCLTMPLVVGVAVSLCRAVDKRREMRKRSRQTQVEHAVEGLSSVRLLNIPKAISCARLTMLHKAKLNERN